MAKKMGRPADPKNREKILRTATEMFIEIGFEATSIPEFSRRAEVSTAHMYIYWENKEAMLEEVVEQVLRENYTMLFDLLRETESTHNVEERVDLCLDLIATLRPRALFIIRSIAKPGMEERMAKLLAQVNSEFGASPIAFPNVELREADRAFAIKMMIAIINSYYLYGDLDVAKKSIKRLIALLSNT